MKDLKRTVKKYGAPRVDTARESTARNSSRHRGAVENLPTILQMGALENRSEPQVRKLRQILETQDVVLLDYETKWRRE
ncbi:MAG: hypothetical protein U0176_12850 [Bacteroidia bacterium]